MPWNFHHAPTPDADGDVRRVTSFLRFRSEQSAPESYPEWFDDEDRNSYALWLYIREVQRFWRVRERETRPELWRRGWRAWHLLKRRMRARFGNGKEI